MRPEANEGMNKTFNEHYTDYVTNHLHDPEMKKLNILVTNSIQ